MRGNQAEKNSRVAVCNYIFLPPWTEMLRLNILHGPAGNFEFYVRVHTDHNEVFHILLLVNSKCITDLLVKLFFL